MGDISELRGLIVIFSFIAVFVFLIGLIPTQFLIADYEGRTVDIPDYFESIDIQSFAETWNTTMDGADAWATEGGIYRYDVDIGGHNFDFEHDKANASYQEAWFIHYYSIYIIIPQWHQMEWINREGVSRDKFLSSGEMDNDYLNNNLEYTIKCPHFQAKVFFDFNETLYSSPSEAWNHNALNILVGINFDQTSTGYSAWDLIAMLLFFQLPDVHWIINALIAIPLWVAIAYLSFILILRAIGAVFGGGGA